MRIALALGAVTIVAIAATRRGVLAAILTGLGLGACVALAVVLAPVAVHQLAGEVHGRVTQLLMARLGT
jgi:hypothetical protein